MHFLPHYITHPYARPDIILSDFFPQADIGGSMVTAVPSEIHPPYMI